MTNSRDTERAESVDAPEHDAPSAVERLYDHVAHVDETDSELADLLGTLAENRHAYLSGNGVSLPDYTIGGVDATATVGAAVRFGMLLGRTVPTPDGRGGPIPDELLLEDFLRVGATVGRRPIPDDIDEHGAFSPRTYHERFGGILPAAEAATDQPGADAWELPKGLGDITLGDGELWTCPFCGGEHKRPANHLSSCDEVDRSPLGVESDD